MTPEEIAKLPKWAQAKIEQLFLRIETIETENATLRGEVVNPFIFSTDEVPLFGAKSLFRKVVTIGKPESRERWLIELDDENNLEITAPWTSQGLAVHPWVSNVIRVKTVERK